MEDIAIQEAYPQLDGRNMTMILSPDKKAPKTLKAKASEQDSESVVTKPRSIYAENEKTHVFSKAV